MDIEILKGFFGVNGAKNIIWQDEKMLITAPRRAGIPITKTNG